MSLHTNILQASDLTIGYTSKKGKNTIAEHLNLKLEQGQLVSLVGGNGIGKSTLLRTLTGIQKPLSGKVMLNEKEIHLYEATALAQNLSLVLNPCASFFYYTL